MRVYSLESSRNSSSDFTIITSLIIGSGPTLTTWAFWIMAATWTHVVYCHSFLSAPYWRWVDGNSCISYFQDSPPCSEVFILADCYFFQPSHHQLRERWPRQNFLDANSPEYRPSQWAKACEGKCCSASNSIIIINHLFSYTIYT